MKKYKVVELFPSICEGGAETLIKDYCLFLSKENFEMQVVTLLPPSPDSSNCRILKENGIKITTLDRSRKFYKNWFLRNLWRYSIRPFYASYQLKKYVAKECPDCIHAHLRMLEYLWRISGSLNNIKLFYTCHNEAHLFFKNFKSIQELWGAKYLIRKKNLHMIALHQEMRNDINQMFGIDNTLVVHNGVDFSRFKNVDVNQPEYRKSIGFSQDDFLVGHIGRFNEQKNHKMLLRIFKEIISKRPNAKLLMIGDGALRPQVEQDIDNLNIREHCKILEHRSDIPELLSIMDVFLFPSFFEGLPVTLVEAQAVGLRCVVSDTITKECYFSKQIIPISLNHPIEDWCKAVLDSSIEGDYEFDINRFDMNSEIKYLGNLYLNER